MFKYFEIFDLPSWDIIKGDREYVYYADRLGTDFSIDGFTKKVYLAICKFEQEDDNYSFIDIVNYLGMNIIEIDKHLAILEQKNYIKKLKPDNKAAN